MQFLFIKFFIRLSGDSIYFANRCNYLINEFYIQMNQLGICKSFTSFECCCYFQAWFSALRFQDYSIFRQYGDILNFKLVCCLAVFDYDRVSLYTVFCSQYGSEAIEVE